MPLCVGLYRHQVGRATIYKARWNNLQHSSAAGVLKRLEPNTGQFIVGIFKYRTIWIKVSRCNTIQHNPLCTMRHNYIQTLLKIHEDGFQK